MRTFTCHSTFLDGPKLNKEVQTCKPVDGLAGRPLVSIVSNKESRITAPQQMEQSTCMMYNVPDPYQFGSCEFGFGNTFPDPKDFMAFESG